MIVLSTATTVRRNPWLGEWLRASAAAGVQERQLSERRLLARGTDRPSGVHLQWPERVLVTPSQRKAFAQVLRLLAQVLLARARGLPVLLSAHNVVSHDQRHPLLERFLWAMITRCLTDVRVLSWAGREELLQRHPALGRCRWHEVPHGDYPAATRAARDADAAAERSSARQALGLGQNHRVLLTFGALKAYKGTVELIEAFGRWDEPMARLVVLGTPPSVEDEAALRRAAGEDPRVHLQLEKTDDDDLLAALAAADTVVLPYRAVLNSGSALLALSSRRAVLLPSTPTFTDLRDRCGAAWVHLFQGGLSAADLTLAADGTPRASDGPDLSWCTWSDIEEAIAAMWRSVV